MKRIKAHINKFAPLLAFLLMAVTLAAVFTVSAFAEGEDVYIWRITHSDGSVEYSDSFSGAFSRFSEGDVFKFLPKEYYLYKKDFASVKPTVDITIDLRGSVIYAPEIGDLEFNPDLGEVNGQMFSVSLKNGAHVDVLLEDAEIYAPLGGRCAFQVSGNGTINFDGGEAGGRIFAPGGLNLTTNPTDPNAWSYMRNVYVYKSSANMAGCVCARENAKLRLIDCTVIGLNGNNLPLLIRNSAHMVLDNTLAACLNGGNVLEISQLSSGAAFTVLGGSAVYGNLKGIELGITVDFRPNSYFTHNVTPYSDAATASVNFTENYIVSYGTKTDIEGQSVQEYRYTKEEKTSDFTFGYAVTERNDTTKVHMPGYPWKLTDSSGSTIYSKTLSPLALSTAYNKAELVENVTSRYTNVLLLSSDLKLMIAKDITLAADADISNVFVTRGSGSLSVEISGSISVPTARLVFAHNGNVSVRGVNDPSPLAIGELAFARCGNVSASELDCYSYTGRALSASAGSVTVYNSTIYADNVTYTNVRTVFGGTDVLINNSSVISQAKITAIGADGKVTLNGEIYVTGAISSEKLEASDKCFFTEPPHTSEGNSTVISEALELPLLLMGKDGRSTVTVAFLYRTESYTLDDEATESSVWRLEYKDGSVKYAKHIYVPFSYASDYTSMTLLSDISFSSGVSIELSGDIIIDLSGRKITAEGKLTSGAPLISAKGDGKLTLKLSDSILLLPEASLMYIDDINSVHIIADGAYTVASSLISAVGTDISLTGGYYSVGGMAINSANGSVTLTNATLAASDVGTLISSYKDISLFDGARVLASTGGGAVNAGETLYLASDVMVYGTVKTARISAGEGAYLSYNVSDIESNMPSRAERNSVSLPMLSYSEGAVQQGTKKYIFSYRLLPIESGLSLSLSFDCAAGVNIYVPKSVAQGDFILRIMLNGVLYNATVDNAKKITVSGIDYMCYTYRYMYPGTYGCELTVTMISNGFVKVLTTTPERIIKESFSAADDNTKTVIAAYANLASKASGIGMHEDSEIISYIPRYTDLHADTERLRKYVSYLAYDVGTESLTLGMNTENASLMYATYTFDGYTLNSDTGGGKDALSLKIYRVLPNSEIILTVTEKSGETAIISTNLYTLSALAADGGSADTYLALIMAYHKARGAVLA